MFAKKFLILTSLAFGFILIQAEARLGDAYVTNSDLFGGPISNVSVIDTVTDTVFATITVGNGPVGVAITPDGTKGYVTNV